MRFMIPNSSLANARLAWPTHSSKTSYKVKFNISTPLFVCGSLSNKNTWVTLSYSHKLKV